MKSSRNTSKRVMAPELKQSSIFGHVSFSKPGQKSTDFQFDFGVTNPGDKEASTAESTKKKPRAALSKAKSIILVPKKVISKKRNISQLKGKKEGPTKKKLKIEASAPAIVANKNLEISALSTSTQSLVAKLLKEKAKVEPKEPVKLPSGDILSIKPYSSSTQDLLSRLKPSAVVMAPAATSSQELLQVSHKLVLPLKYRSLLKMQEFLDSALNYLGTRHPDWIPMKEIQ